MGKRALEQKQKALRLRDLNDDERKDLRSNASYQGSPYHKKNPGDFGLTPPASPRPDATLCDEAGILNKSAARALFERALDRGLVSYATTREGLPKQLFVVSDEERVFAAIDGGNGHYHGYPIRKSDPLFDKIVAAWNGE